MSTKVDERTALYDTRLDRDTAMTLAAQEYALFAATLAELTDEEWQTPTCCPGWTVRDIAGHTFGMAEFSASLPVMARQLVRSELAAKKSGKPSIDELTDLQVRKHAHLGTAELVAALERTGPKAAAARRRRPALLRSFVVDEESPDGTPERWKIGFLFDTILTRDPWMHRSDIADALGRPMEVTPEHDGVLVADVVAEWAGRHGQPYDLTLTGPAGGHWSSGTDGEVIHMDAEQFCRIVSGRGTGTGLMATSVPF